MRRQLSSGCGPQFCKILGEQAFGFDPIGQPEPISIHRCVQHSAHIRRSGDLVEDFEARRRGAGDFLKLRSDSPMFGDFRGRNDGLGSRRLRPRWVRRFTGAGSRPGCLGRSLRGASGGPRVSNLLDLGPRMFRSRQARMRSRFGSKSGLSESSTATRPPGVCAVNPPDLIQSAVTPFSFSTLARPTAPPSVWP